MVESDEHVPVGDEARERWLTVLPQREVLLAAHTVVAAQQLMEIAGLLRGDPRVRLLFTRVPHPLNAGVDEFLREAGVRVLPWTQAAREEFALAVVAEPGHMEDLRASVMYTSHGASRNKLTRRRSNGGVAVRRRVTGFGPQYLVRDGMVMPSAIALAHDLEVEQLASECPEAVTVAQVTGDVCYDRITASLDRRPLYRRALGIGEEQQLVVVASTWTSASLIGSGMGLLGRLVDQLDPEEFTVALLTHPAIWAGHSAYEVRGWVHEMRRRGLIVLEPRAEWRAALVAADFIVGDHGSATLYGSAVGVPMLIATFPEWEVNPLSGAAALARIAPALSPDLPLAEQLAHARADYDPGAYEAVARLITCEPGRWAANTRRLLYRLLRMGQPATAARVEPLAAPRVTRWGDQ